MSVRIVLSMKIYIVVILAAILALLVDIYIYRRVIRRHNFGRVWKVGYLIYAVLTDIAALVALILYRSVADWDGTVLLRVVMTVIGLYVLNVVPKGVYAFISLGDYPLQRIRNNGRVSHVFGYTGTAAAFVVLCVLGYGMTFGRIQLRVERVELQFDNLPASFDGLTIAHFSDSHMGTAIDIRRFNERMVAAINALEPDMVVNSGDIVNAYAEEMSPEVVEILGRMKPRYGVYSVIGNHDLGIYIKDTLAHPRRSSLEELVRRQEALGWTVLRNQTIYLSNGADSIAVTGIDYPEDNTLNSHSKHIEGADVAGSYAGVPDSLFNLTISHAPQVWDDILAEGKADLTLAGHVHAMQMKFRLGKRAWSPAMLKYDRWSGLYEEAGRYLYINDGLGCVVFPMRVGTRPEITLYTLRTKK